MENAYINYWLEDNVLFGAYNNVEVKDMDILRESINQRFKLTGNKSYPFLLDATKVRSITKEARDFLASKESEKGIKVGAILVESKVSEIIGNFFLKINKPKIPARIFTDREKALDWLKNYPF